MHKPANHAGFCVAVLFGCRIRAKFHCFIRLLFFFNARNKICTMENLKGKRVGQGVSLANSVFRRSYARGLMEWLRANEAAHLDVWIADAIEPINYKVFRNVSVERAERYSRERGMELKRMFERLIPDGFSCDVFLESESPLHSNPNFKNAMADVERAYDQKGQFHHDVEAQVMLNLLKRRERHGDDFIKEKMSDLSRYILDELAFFYSYFTEYPDVVEIYPGASLMVKDRLFAGEYKDEGLDLSLEHLPTFIDTSFLIEES